MFEFEKIMKDYEKLTTVERGLILTENRSVFSLNLQLSISKS